MQPAESGPGMIYEGIYGWREGGSWEYKSFSFLGGWKPRLTLRGKGLRRRFGGHSGWSFLLVGFTQGVLGLERQGKAGGEAQERKDA